MNYVDFFYKNIIKNLSLKKVFIHEIKKKYQYSDIKKFYFSFYKIINQFKKGTEQLKICTLSKKSFFLYSSIISILLSKNIWVPLDEDMPLKIMKYILKTSKVDIVLIDNTNEKKFSKFLKKNKIKYINIEKINLNKGSKISLNYQDYEDNDLAMIFFTSGSTGNPKGVVMTNKNFISSLKGQMEHIYKRINVNKLVFGDYHNTSFVISLVILFPCLLLKSRISPATNYNDKINPLIHVKKNKVNCIVTLPSTIDRIKSLNSNFANLNITALLMCGETFYYDNFKFIIDKIKPKSLFNCYGSTEVSPWVFSYEYKIKDLDMIKSLGLVPIGKKFYNVKYTISKQELNLSGPMITNYLNILQNNTNHKKIANKTWFLTSDKIKKINNLIYVIGRSDSVIKLRGYRIELIGIESKIREFDQVTNCFVFLSSGKNKKIIAAIESKSKSIKDNLEKYLVKNLQAYMIPKKFIFYSQFPKNKNDKIDRYLIKKINLN
jgi:acyl-coenzyme A synthetase/AMP-(fatty) acid ligase